MKEYQLGNNKILTTEKRYETTFKALGYVPVAEKKVEKPKKIEKVEKPKTIEKIGE